MKSFYFLRKFIIFLLFFSLLVSCRLGEIMAEADPETNAEYDPAEKEELDTVVPPKKDELQTEVKENQ